MLALNGFFLLLGLFAPAACWFAMRFFLASLWRGAFRPLPAAGVPDRAQWPLLIYQPLPRAWQPYGVAGVPAVLVIGRF
jgi:hypothetical protein